MRPGDGPSRADGPCGIIRARSLVGEALMGDKTASQMDGARYSAFSLVRNALSGHMNWPLRAFRSDGFFITSDLGRMDADGYLWIVGRDKDLIISGGLNVYPAEVENELDAIAGIAESAVIGAPHVDFGEGVVAVVVRRVAENLTAAKIIEVLGERVAGFKLPKKIFFVNSLPRNTMGKVRKNVLRETYAGAFPRNPRGVAC